MDYTLEAIVANVDLRLPLKPAPIFFLGGTDIDGEVVAAINRSMGNGEVVSVAETPPQYVVFVSRSDGRVDPEVWKGIEGCFLKYGTEACIFEYMRIEKYFRLKTRGYFVPERIA